MSDRIPPGAQSRWRDQRGGSRGPGRTGRATLLPPGVIPAGFEALDEPGPDEEEDTEVAAQKSPSGRPGPAGDPKAPPAGPHTPPPPSPPQPPPEK